MQFEVGMVLDAKVTGITNFGAFLDLGEGKSGMVHISEVALSYVKDIHDFLTEGQMVKAKIIAIFPDGKINLSIKKAMENTQTAAQPNHSRPPRADGPKRPAGRPTARPAAKPVQTASTLSEGPQSFEDMLSQFKQKSDERIADLKHSDGNRRSTARSRRK